MRKYILIFSGCCIVVLMIFGRPLTTKQQAICLHYKGTRVKLIMFSLTFYPDIMVSKQLIQSGYSYEIKESTVDKEEIKDIWGNNFKLSGDGHFVYSFGKNKVDEAGLGDDVRIINQESKGLYCPDSENH